MSDLALIPIVRIDAPGMSDPRGGGGELGR
jgi:hypothetical protein